MPPGYKIIVLVIVTRGFVGVRCSYIFGDVDAIKTLQSMFAIVQSVLYVLIGGESKEACAPFVWRCFPGVEAWKLLLLLCTLQDECFAPT